MSDILQRPSLAGHKIYAAINMKKPLDRHLLTPTDFQKNNLTASSVGDVRHSTISSLLSYEINFLKIYDI